MGFFSSEAQIDDYVEELTQLHADGSRKDIRWKYGIDDDLINSDIKQVEVRNWIRMLLQ